MRQKYIGFFLSLFFLSCANQVENFDNYADQDDVGSCAYAEMSRFKSGEIKDSYVKTTLPGLETDSNYPIINALVDSKLNQRKMPNFFLGLIEAFYRDILKTDTPQFGQKPGSPKPKYLADILSANPKNNAYRKFYDSWKEFKCSINYNSQFETNPKSYSDALIQKFNEFEQDPVLGGVKSQLTKTGEIGAWAPGFMTYDAYWDIYELMLSEQTFNSDYFILDTLKDEIVINNLLKHDLFKNIQSELQKVNTQLNAISNKTQWLEFSQNYNEETKLVLKTFKLFFESMGITEKNFPRTESNGKLNLYQMCAVMLNDFVYYRKIGLSQLFVGPDSYYEMAKLAGFPLEKIRVGFSLQSDVVKMKKSLESFPAGSYYNDEPLEHNFNIGSFNMSAEAAMHYLYSKYKIEQKIKKDSLLKTSIRNIKNAAVDLQNETKDKKTYNFVKKLFSNNNQPERGPKQQEKDLLKYTLIDTALASSSFKNFIMNNEDKTPKSIPELITYFSELRKALQTIKLPSGQKPTYTIGGFTFCNHFEETVRNDKTVDSVMFTNYGPGEQYCVGKMTHFFGPGPGLDISKGLFDNDQRPTWYIFRERFGPKFSETWVSSNRSKDKFNDGGDPFFSDDKNSNGLGGLNEYLCLTLQAQLFPAESNILPRGVETVNNSFSPKLVALNRLWTWAHGGSRASVTRLLQAACVSQYLNPESSGCKNAMSVLPTKKAGYFVVPQNYNWLLND